MGFILEIDTDSDNLSQRNKSLNYSHTIVVQNVTLTDDTPQYSFHEDSSREWAWHDHNSANLYSHYFCCQHFAWCCTIRFWRQGYPLLIINSTSVVPFTFFFLLFTQLNTCTIIVLSLMKICLILKWRFILGHFEGL